MSYAAAPSNKVHRTGNQCVPAQSWCEVSPVIWCQGGDSDFIYRCSISQQLRQWSLTDVLVVTSYLFISLSGELDLVNNNKAWEWTVSSDVSLVLEQVYK